MTGESAGHQATAGPPPPGPTWGAGAVTLAVATTVGHALSYAFSLVLSRALGPADFGALGALLAVGIVASVPATALQTQVARLAAVSPGGADLRRGYRLGWTIGGSVALVMTVLAIPLAALLRLDSALGVLLLSAGLIPLGALGARQGVLLGRGAFTMLAAASVLVPALRLVGAGVAAGSGVGVSGALGLQAAATWLGLLAVIGLVRTLPNQAGTDSVRAPGPSAASLLAATSGLVGLFVLANVDVLLARAFLTDVDSGVYAVASIGAKVVFWGSHFVALLVFPRVARGEGDLSLVLRAGAVVAVVGGAAALLSVPLAPPVLDFLVGPAYADAAAVAPWFVVLGTLLALVQLSTYASLAADRRRFSAVLWGAVIGQVAVIALLFHGNILQIVAVCIAGNAMLVLAAVVMSREART